MYPLVAVFIGAGLGASLRYGLALALTPLFPALPLGTLAANLLGAYLAGLAAAWFIDDATLPQRLFVMTGFLGGLTTFSAFSVEIVALLQAGRWVLAAAGAALHVAGSLLLTLAGMWTVRSLLASQ